MPRPPVPDPLPADELRRLVDLDRAHVWHPFTAVTDWESEDPLLITGGQHEWLFDAAGGRWLDGVSSLWCNVFGHRRPEIDAAVRGQLDRIAHSTLLGLAGAPAAELAGRLAEIAPPGLTRVFFSDDGATAVEVALKMSFQYWAQTGRPGRTRFIAVRGGYHGDTLGAVGVGGVDAFHRLFRPLLMQSLFAPAAYCRRCELGLRPESCGLACVEEVGRLLEAHRGEVAAVVIEPLVQGAGGMITAPAGYLRRLRELTTAAGVHLIADEVAVGLGRTGHLFACDAERVAPDFLCLAKGLTGGYLPLAATMTTDAVYDAFRGRAADRRTFFHGHTYCGNALGAAAALATLELLAANPPETVVPPMAARLAEGLAPLRGHPHVGEVRQRGLMAGIELEADPATKERFPFERMVGRRVCRAMRKHGVLVRPLGDVVVLMPPLCTRAENLDLLARAAVEAIDEVTREG